MNKIDSFMRAGIFNVLVSIGVLCLSLSIAFVKLIPTVAFFGCFYLLFNFIEE